MTTTSKEARAFVWLVRLGREFGRRCVLPRAGEPEERPLSLVVMSKGKGKGQDGTKQRVPFRRAPSHGSLALASDSASHAMAS